MQGQMQEGIDDGPLDWIQTADATAIAQPPHLQASITCGVVNAVAKVRRAMTVLLLEDEMEENRIEEQAAAVPRDRQMAGSLLKQHAMAGIDDEVSLGE